MRDSVIVSTPSRLHFGLLRFQSASGRSFGGVGAMIDSPRCVIEIRFADRWTATGPDASRARRFAQLALEAWAGRPERNTALEIEVVSAIPSHHGLGAGTQLGLAVAVGVRNLLNLPACSIAECARAVARGGRSAVGAHGFDKGGLIWEDGWLPGEGLGALVRRVDLPPAWRIVLLSNPRSSGICGQPECDAFSAVPPVPRATVDRLIQIAEHEVFPAVETSNIDGFGEALHNYGRLAGECFAAVQGGAYANKEIAKLVERLRSLGVKGVGQSSWGPTVYAFVTSQEHAESLVAELGSNSEAEGLSLTIARPDNQGAVITRRPGDVCSEPTVRASASEQLEARADYSNP